MILRQTTTSKDLCRGVEKVLKKVCIVYCIKNGPVIGKAVCCGQGGCLR